jgi:hypothetical protein
MKTRMSTAYVINLRVFLYDDRLIQKSSGCLCIHLHIVHQFVWVLPIPSIDLPGMDQGYSGKTWRQQAYSHQHHYITPNRAVYYARRYPGAPLSLG